MQEIAKLAEQVCAAPDGTRADAAIVARRTRAGHRFSRGGRSAHGRSASEGVGTAHRAPGAMLTRVHPGRRQEPLERNGFRRTVGGRTRKGNVPRPAARSRRSGRLPDAWNCCRRCSERRAVETGQRWARRSERAAGVMLDIAVSSACGGDGSDQPLARQPLQRHRVPPHDPPLAPHSPSDRGGRGRASLNVPTIRTADQIIGIIRRSVPSSSAVSSSASSLPATSTHASVSVARLNATRRLIDTRSSVVEPLQPAVGGRRVGGRPRADSAGSSESPYLCCGTGATPIRVIGLARTISDLVGDAEVSAEDVHEGARDCELLSETRS